MSRAAALLAALSSEPASTSELYDRLGYRALVRLGLVPYDSFKAELTKLAAAGAVERDTGPDGSTRWRLSPSGE